MDTMAESERSSQTHSSQTSISTTSSKAKEQPESVVGEPEDIVHRLNAACETGDLSRFQQVYEKTPINFSTLKWPGDTTPLHIASQRGHRDIVQYILKQNPSFQEDGNKNTPLHLAAAEGHTAIAQDLLQYASKQNKDASESARCNVFCQLNDKGRSPLGCTLLGEELRLPVAKAFLLCAEGKPENAFPDFGKSVFPKFESRSLDKPVNLFVLGDHNVGKSTLICSLQENPGGLIAALRNRRTVEGINKHYTGIVQTEFSSPNLQRMILHELAGHVNFFNEKLFESLEALGSSIFVVMVNLKDNLPKTEDRLVYWLSFLRYYMIRAGSDSKPNVLVIGSHVDATRGFWRNKNHLEEVYENLQKKHSKLADCFEFLQRPLSVDCRKLDSFEMRSLRGAVQRTYQKVRPLSTKLPSCMSYVLNGLLTSQDFSDRPVLSLGELASKIKEDADRSDLNLCKLLPHEPSELLPLCEALKENERILLFKNPLKPEIENTWIVHNSYMLLTNMDKKLKQLSMTMEDGSQEGEQSFRAAFLANFGIVSQSTLEAALAVEDLNLDPKLAVQLLQHFKYCELVDISGEAGSEPYFFLPGLLEDIGEPDPWKGSGFGFAWCIAPSNEQKSVFKFFLPRFLKKLLLSLTQRFIQSPGKLQMETDDDSDTSAIKRSEVGDRAISWKTSQGINVVIFVNDNEIILNMYCSQPNTELSCLQLRNYIVGTIREQQALWQPEISTTEFLIPFSGNKFNFPVRSSEYYQKVLLSEIQKSLLQGKTECDGECLESVLFHDPCMVLAKLDTTAQQFLSDPENIPEQVSEGLLRGIAQAIGTRERLLYSALQLPQASSTEEDGASSRNSPWPREGRKRSTSSSDSGGRPVQTVDDLLRYFDSFSVCKSINFLQELQNQPEVEVLIDDDEDCIFPTATDYSRQASGISTLKRPSKSDFVIVRSQSNLVLPFINTVSSFQCDSKELTINSEAHGIVVRFQAGSVPKNSPAIKVEFGVLLSGPFELPPEVSLVSPILWLGTDQQPGFKFNKTVEISLPHCIEITSEDSKNLTVYRCIPNDLSDIPFTLALSSKDALRFSRKSGTISTKHPGFYCICYKNPEEMVRRARYSIVSVVPDEDLMDTKSFAINVFVTLALKTCLELVSKELPGCKYRSKNFKFAPPPQGCEAAVEVTYEKLLRSGWMAAHGSWGKKILQTEANPFNELEDADNYPPRFTIEISGERASRSDVFCIKLSGTHRDPISSDFHLRHTGDGLSLHSSNLSVASFNLTPHFLKRHTTTIAQFLDMNEISSHLTRLSILTTEETDILLHQRGRLGSTPTAGVTSRKINEDFVQMLCSKGVEGFQRFVNALEQTTNGTGHSSILTAFQLDPEYDSIML